MPRTHLRVGGSGTQVLEPSTRCAHCRRIDFEKNFVEESNPDSPVYGMLVCKRDTCLEGPVQKVKQYGADDIGPVRNFGL